MLDTACARVAIGLNTSPAAIEAASRQIDQIERERKILERESLLGRDHAERIEALKTKKEASQLQLDELTRKWEDEMEIAGDIREVRRELQEVYAKDPADTASLSQKQEMLKELEGKLAKVQGDTPLVQLSVDPEIISEVIMKWKKPIPMSWNFFTRFLTKAFWKMVKDAGSILKTP